MGLCALEGSSGDNGIHERLRGGRNRAALVFGCVRLLMHEQTDGENHSLFTHCLGGGADSFRKPVLVSRSGPLLLSQFLSRAGGHTKVSHHFDVGRLSGDTARGARCGGQWILNTGRSCSRSAGRTLQYAVRCKCFLESAGFIIDQRLRTSGSLGRGRKSSIFHRLQLLLAVAVQALLEL